MIKQLAKFVLMVLVTSVAGAFGGWLAFSRLLGESPFDSKIAVGDPVVPMQITQTKEVTIQENQALKNAAAKVGNIAIGVKVTSAKGVATYGSGVIFTSDGMVAIPYSLFGPGTTAEVTARNKKTAFEVLKRDKAKNITLIKLESANWPTAGFYPSENLKLGERVFLLGVLADGNNFISEGVVRNFNADSVGTSIWEKNEALGSPVFDIEGNILGIAVPDKAGLVGVIPIWTVKTLAGL